MSWLGGVRLEGEGLEDYEDFDGPTLAHVRCDVQQTSAPMPKVAPRIHFHWQEGRARLDAGPWRGSLQAMEDGEYDATIAIPRHGEEQAAAMLSAAVRSHAGGLDLHAAVADIGGAAIAFVGPSGAGKSTALGLTEGATTLAVDRAAVFQHGDGWWVSALPGGSPGEPPQPHSDEVCLPLLAIARVVHGEGTPGYKPASGVDAMALVRAATVHPPASPRVEKGLLATALRLAEQVPVGVVATVLEVSLNDTLAAWLGPYAAERFGDDAG